MKRFEYKKIIKYIWLVLLFVAVLLFLSQYFELETDDDSGAEMILSNFLSKKGGILTKDWYYSSELRIINIQIVYTFLFKFITNWHVVRIIGNAIMYIIMLSAVWYLCKQLHIGKYFAYISAFFIVPISHDYYINALHSAYLLPHITFSVLMMAMFLHYMQSTNSKTKKIITILLPVTSFVVGLGGIRHVFVFFIPLILACCMMVYENRETIFNKFSINEYNVKNLCFAIVMFICAFAGFIINHFILKNIFSFSTYYINNESFFTGFVPEQFLNVFNGWLYAYGYHTDKSIFSLQTLVNCLPIVIIMLIVIGLRKVINKKCEDIQQKIVGYFYLIGVILLTVLFTFSTMMYADRYLVPIVVFAYPIIFVAIDRLKFSEFVRKGIIIAIAILISVCTLLNYRDLSKNDNSAESRQVADILLENGYYNGYTFHFWKFGNNLVEYSDGQIEIWHKRNDLDDETNDLSESSLNYSKQWLEVKSHDKEEPAGKIFLIAPKRYISLDKGVILYESENVVVYGYNSIGDLRNDF